MLQAPAMAGFKASKAIKYRRPLAVDLFAGAGGFSLGIEQAGFDVAVAVEIDPIHAAVCAFNAPNAKVLCADIKQVTAELIWQKVAQWQQQSRRGERELAPAIDLVVGGPPCQGFSIMGHRRLDDDRNDLVFHFCRLVTELQPRYFIMENVPGMKQGKHAAYLQELLARFAAAGYQVTQPIQILNAADFGVPQSRQRLFLLGAALGEVPLTYPQPTDRRTTVREAIADLPNLDDFPQLLASDEVWLSPEAAEQMQAAASWYASQLMDIQADPDNFAARRLWHPQLLTSSLRTQHSDASVERFKQTLPKQLESISRLRRLDWESTCHTLRAGTGAVGGRHTSPRPIHPCYPRTISVREAARLHSFPDWFRFHWTKWHGFRQIGNAVPPLLARAVGKQAIAALGIQPIVPPETLALGKPQWLKFNVWQARRWQREDGEI